LRLISYDNSDANDKILPNEGTGWTMQAGRYGKHRRKEMAIKMLATELGFKGRKL
jgi:hypothetical protein